MTDASGTSNGDITPNLPPSAQAIYRELAVTEEYLTAAELADRADVTPSTVRDAIQMIRDYRKVRALPSPAEGRRHLYWLPETNETNAE